ncbi:MAG: phosphoribosylformylglycinamidine synthase subunit PurQ [Prevotellaceae bacterium]|nr:phosphoribosylformylglycinamidine synthase subunit PurQ [Prevotellaceae bacterium]
MKFGVVIFPGSNCDHDMIYVMRNILGQEVVQLWHKDVDLQNVDGILLPGGFSYGDYLRSGALARFSPVMSKITQFANDGGFVFGICNGFQILCEANLLPGALLHNNNQKFICRNTFILPDGKNACPTYFLDKNKALKIPVAHGEGRYFADEQTLEELKNNEQIIFRYCSKDGNISDESNPNGSLENIAGICNSARNVYGMMPHPERAADKNLGNTDGLLIFESMLEMMQQQK